MKLSSIVPKIMSWMFIASVFTCGYFVFVDSQPTMTNYQDWGVVNAIEMVGGTPRTISWGAYKYNSVHMPSTTIVKAGGSMTMWRSICFTRDTYMTIGRQFVDGIVYSAPLQDRFFKQGCGVYVTKIPIPSTLPSGEYDLSTLVTLKTNPFIENHLVLPNIHLLVVSDIPGNVTSPESGSELSVSPLTPQP